METTAPNLSSKRIAGLTAFFFGFLCGFLCHLISLPEKTVNYFYFYASKNITKKYTFITLTVLPVPETGLVRKINIH